MINVQSFSQYLMDCNIVGNDVMNFIISDIEEYHSMMFQGECFITDEGLLTYIDIFQQTSNEIIGELNTSLTHRIDCEDYKKYDYSKLIIHKIYTIYDVLCIVSNINEHDLLSIKTDYDSHCFISSMFE